MSIVASSLLARLEELKKWQIKQQERLLQQQQSRMECTNSTIISKCETVEGLSSLNSLLEINQNDSKLSSHDVLIGRDMNIDANKKNNPCTDQNLVQKNYINEINVKCASNSDGNVAKPKRPYLKRGAGLVKFKMNPGDQKRPFNKVIARKPILKQNIEKGDRDNVTDSNKENITPLRPPDLSIKAVWHKVGGDTADLNKKNEENAYDSDTLTKNTILQINELAAQTEVSPKQILSINDNLSENVLLEEIVANTLKHCGNIPQPIDRTSTDQSLYEKALEQELLIFEALEERALNSSFCSTNSSVLRILSSTPSKFKKCLQNVFIEEKVEDSNSISDKGENSSVILVDLRKSNDTHDQIDTCNISDKLNSMDSSVTSEDLQEVDVSNTNHNDDQPWSDVNPYTRENSSLSSVSVSSSKGSEKEVTLISESEILTKETCTTGTEDILANKLKELDDEIQNFRKENAKLQKTKYEFEKQQREFKKEKKAFEKYILEEKINVEFYLEDEKKKLAKEKMVFERYVKDTQNKTTRKEREEISALKDELANVKEAAKLKETRNATSQARLRNQIKSFEKEVANLKDELEKLRKQNAKLVSTQKVNRKSSDAKMLQEINKNLSKLTKDAKVSEQIKKVESSVSKKKNLIESLEREKNIGKKSVEKEETKEFRNRKKKSDVEESDEDEVNDCEKQDFCYNYEYFLNNNKSKEDKHSDEMGCTMDNENEEHSNDSLRNETNISLEKSYEKMFGKSSDDELQQKEKDRKKQPETVRILEKSKSLSENVLSDGSTEITYPNGNVKTTSPDGNFIWLKFFNGDIKETKLLEGVIRYYYTENQCWQTNMPNGDEILEYPNGQVEKKLKDGTTEIKFPNGILKTTRADSTETILYPDGTKVDVHSKDGKVISLPNGQREIHTPEHMRREYPDGTVKILYPDGIQETRYSNGRIRIKDKSGNLLLDSHDDT